MWKIIQRSNLYYMENNNLKFEASYAVKKDATPEEISKILRQEAHNKGFYNVKIIRNKNTYKIYHNDKLIFINDKGWLV